MNIVSFCIALLLPFCLQAKIVESKAISEILTHIPQNGREEVLLVCDLDNTLMRSKHQLGSVSWGEHVKENMLKKGVSKKEAQNIENIFWRAVHQKIPVELVDPEAAAILTQCHLMEVPVYGLTAREPIDAPFTHLQLASLGLTFTSTLPRQEFELQGPALFDKGILFATSFNKKSQVLLHFLQHHKLTPELVIFVDDKQSHVQDVLETLEKHSIPCIGIRFSGADHHVSKFNPLIAECQWKAFPRILSDEEALAIIHQ